MCWGPPATVAARTRAYRSVQTSGKIGASSTLDHFYVAHPPGTPGESMFDSPAALDYTRIEMEKARTIRLPEKPTRATKIELVPPLHLPAPKKPVRAVAEKMTPTVHRRKKAEELLLQSFKSLHPHWKETGLVKSPR